MVCGPGILFFDLHSSAIHLSISICYVCGMRLGGCLRMRYFSKIKEGEKYNHRNTLKYFEDYNLSLT